MGATAITAAAMGPGTAAMGPGAARRGAEVARTVQATAAAVGPGGGWADISQIYLMRIA